MGQVKPATVYLDVHVHRKLKVRAAQQGKTISSLVAEAVCRLLTETDDRGAEPAGPRLRLDWAGALADLKDEYTSVELQHKSRDWHEGR